MSQRYIPEHVDPQRFAEQSLNLTGAVRIADMKRLTAVLNNENDLVSAELDFGVDEQGVTFLKGRLRATIVLTCQRCLKPFNYEIISNFALGVIHKVDEANTLPEHYEPALTTDGQLALRELIEDEIILNLPIIPRHEHGDCEVRLPVVNADWKPEQKENPFQVLASLKHKQDPK